MKVSIIIPVYNVEKYLRRCLDSVLSQTYSNLEIVIVDDGSKDSSGQICDEYAKKDNRIIVIHKENGGLSSARNVGIEKCTGDAIYFLDSDDYISSECIEKSIGLLVKNNASVAILQMLLVSEDTNEEIEQEESEKEILLNPQEAIEESLYQKLFTCCAPSKLYLRKVIGDIRFPLGRISEDLATCHLFLHNTDKVVYSNFYGYYYRQQGNSIMHTFNPKRMDALEWALEIEKFCDEHYPDIIKATICRTFNVSVHLILDLPYEGELHKEYAPSIWNEIKRTRLSVIFDKKSRNREKVAAVLSLFGENTLRKVWNSKLAVRKA